MLGRGGGGCGGGRAVLRIGAPQRGFHVFRQERKKKTRSKRLPAGGEGKTRTHTHSKYNVMQVCQILARSARRDSTFVMTHSVVVLPLLHPRVSPTPPPPPALVLCTRVCAFCAPLGSSALPPTRSRWLRQRSPPLPPHHHLPPNPPQPPAPQPL